MQSRDSDRNTEDGISGEETNYNSSGSENRPNHSSRRSSRRQPDSYSKNTGDEHKMDQQGSMMPNIVTSQNIFVTAESHLRSKRRESMPMLTRSMCDETESVQMTADEHSGEHRRSSGRSSRRNSISGSSILSSSLNRNELPKPRPLDTSLYPIAANMPIRLTTNNSSTTTPSKHEFFQTPEPSVSGRMLRRGSMPTMNTFVHDLPFSSSTTSDRNQPQSRRRSMSHSIPEDTIVVMTTMTSSHHPPLSVSGGDDVDDNPRMPKNQLSCDGRPSRGKSSNHDKNLGGDDKQQIRLSCPNKSQIIDNRRSRQSSSREQSKLHPPRQSGRMSRRSSM
jgi:hypothetical protein